jgi:hypothetical protein
LSPTLSHKELKIKVITKSQIRNRVTMKMKRLKIILQIMVVVDLLLKVNNQQRLKLNLKFNLKMI